MQIMKLCHSSPKPQHTICQNFHIFLGINVYLWLKRMSSRIVIMPKLKEGRERGERDFNVFALRIALGAWRVQKSVVLA
jgi:hypothetical protein